MGLLPMNRRTFLTGAASAIAVSSAVAQPLARKAHARLMNAAPAPSKHPRAITMWEFSWIERHWPGAGYEDWDRALDELRERG
jgi:hypothetical protein